MAKRVIHRLEAVEVNIKDSEIWSANAEARDPGSELNFEMPPIGQAGERVFVRLLGDGFCQCVQTCVLPLKSLNFFVQLARNLRVCGCDLGRLQQRGHILLVWQLDDGAEPPSISGCGI